MTASTFKDLSGKRFGLLKVTGYAGVVVIGKSKTRRSLWNCICYCGKGSTVTTIGLTSGNTKSCGCLKEVGTHGHARHTTAGNSPTYYSWMTMKQRCLNPNANKYRYYGGRGIKICDRWLKFENFLEDMGERPDGLTLDRRESNGDYEPGNCRWATLEEQHKNQRKRKPREYYSQMKEDSKE